MKLGIVNLIENMNDKTFVHDCTWVCGENLFLSVLAEKWDPEEKDGVDSKYHIIHKGTFNQEEG